MNDSAKCATIRRAAVLDTRGAAGMNPGLYRMIREYRRLRREKGLSAANPAGWARIGPLRRSGHPSGNRPARRGSTSHPA